MAVPDSPHARRYYRAAKQRLDDALLLSAWGRTTGAVYLAGYCVECLLKSLILSVVPRSQEDEALAQFHGAHAHEFDWLLYLYFRYGGSRIPVELLPQFTRVSSWSTDMRYSAGVIPARDAVAFLDAVSDIVAWIDGRV